MSQFDKATEPIIYTVILTNADIEYSQPIPNFCKRFSIQPRQNVDVRIAFQSGKVATPIEPFITIKNGISYTETDLYISNIIIYMASSTAGTIMEIVCWV